MIARTSSKVGSIFCQMCSMPLSIAGGPYGGPVTRSATVTPRSMESPRAWDPQEGPASGRVLKSIGTPKTRCANPDSASVEDPMAMLFRLEAPVAAMQVLHDQQ